MRRRWGHATYIHGDVANRNKGYSALTLYYRTPPYNVLKGSALR